MKRTFLIIALVGLGAMAFSSKDSWKVFEAKYHVKPESNLGTAACVNCHIGKHGGKLNAYGKDIQVILKAEGTKKVTPEILAKVEGLDSLKDGQTNISKIKADKNPGKAPVQ